MTPRSQCIVQSYLFTSVSIQSWPFQPPVLDQKKRSEWCNGFVEMTSGLGRSQIRFVSNQPDRSAWVPECFSEMVAHKSRFGIQFTCSYIFKPNPRLTLLLLSTKTWTLLHLQSQLTSDHNDCTDHHDHQDHNDHQDHKLFESQPPSSLIQEQFVRKFP